jgi:hypothetical protein
MCAYACKERKEREMMFVLLATDPGAWNIVGWMLVLGAIGAVILWVVTTLLLRDRSIDVTDETEPGHA